MSGKLVPFERYKDSGVDWLGQIPHDWEAMRGGALFQQRRDAPLPEDEQLSASQKFGVVPQRLLMEWTDSKLALALAGTENFKHVDKDSFVISLRSFEGGIERAHFSGCVSPAYTVLKPSPRCNPGYFEYLLKLPSLIDKMCSMTDSLRDGKSIGFGDFAQIILPLPSEGSQASIAAYLDTQTQRIDTLIKEQQELIELLRKKRQSLISHAVTKGLDPAAKLKDSGVEWLGDIPVTWEVAPIKYIVATPVTDGPHSTPEFFDDGVPFVSAEAISSGDINFEKIRGFISPEDNETFSAKYSPQLNDIFMVKSGATTGTCAIVEGRTDFNIWSPLAVIRCSAVANPKFVLFVLRSQQFQDAIALNWSFGTQQNIGMGVIENLRVPLPPLYEQGRIEKFISEETKKIVCLIDEAESTITLMQEHRSSLISAVVTGKVRVPA